MRRGNADNEVGDWVWLDVQSGTGKDKLGVHTEGPFPVLNKTTGEFVLQRRELVKRVNSYRVEWVPAPEEIDANPKEKELEATPEDLAAKNRGGEMWLVKNEVDRPRLSGGAIQFKLELEGDYNPTWEPQENVPEKLIARYLRRRRKPDRKCAATMEGLQCKKQRYGKKEGPRRKSVFVRGGKAQPVH